MSSKRKRPPDGRMVWEDGDYLMTPPEVAALLRINMNQLYKLNSAGEIPYFKWGKVCRYKYSEVLNWLENQTDDVRQNPILKIDRPLSQLSKLRPVRPVEEDEQKVS